MAAIKGKNTKPEILIRKMLWGAGFRYRLQVKSLPGCPDIVLRRYNAVIFVQGCFWHGHECATFHWPKTREQFWRDKICGNRARDTRNLAVLQDQGWRIAQVWECALKGRGRLPVEQTEERLTGWLNGSALLFELAGR